MGVETLAVMESGRNRNKLFLPLLDKVDCLPHLPPPTDEDFHIKKPSKSDFTDAATNSFGVYAMSRRESQEMSFRLL